MKEIKCAIIQDILPLYIDDVVSEDTKEIVEEHLQHCERCKKEYEWMQQDIVIPVEKEAPVIQKFKKKWRNKKLIVGGLSVVLTASILFSTFFFVFHYDTVIPYSKELIEIEQQANNELVAHYYGVDYYSTNVAGPIKLELNGEEKQIIFLNYTKTVANSPTKKLFRSEGERHDQEFTLGKKENVDAIYYANFDTEKITKEENYWDNVLKNADLLWED